MRSGNHHQSDNQTGVTLSFHRDDLTLRETPFGFLVDLAGLKSGGKPGSPALPRTQVRIAVPVPFWPRELHIDDEQWQTVAEEGTFIAAAQPLRPLLPDDKPADHAERRVRERTTRRPADTPEGVHCAADCSCRTAPISHRLPIAPGPPPPSMVPPDASAYTDAATGPPAARAVRIETVGASHLAVVEISPVRITPRGGVELCTALKMRVEYAAEPQLADRRAAIAEFRARFGDDIDLERVVPRPEPAIASAAESGRLNEIARDLAINGKVVIAAGDWRKRALDNLPCEYLIITDDRRWDADTITPGAAVPGMVTEFDRLAKAKRSRGISARVVTITDIVAGRWGDFRSGSRDLQEVIRKFLKFARTHWGTSWLLLGGDVEIVPVRKVTSPMVGVYPRVATVPDDNQAFWTGTELRIKVGVWEAIRLLLKPEHSTLLNANKGVVIPYEPTATVGRTGWCFYESDWHTRSNETTQYIRVSGPPELVNDDLLFVSPENKIPTDFYYASLVSWVEVLADVGFQLPSCYSPEHDWDALGNGLYGLHSLDGPDLDGVLLSTQLSVGRVPAKDSQDAQIFCSKILTYEGAGTYPAKIDPGWPSHVLLAASNATRSTYVYSSNSSPPDANQFHFSGDRRSVLHVADWPETQRYDVIAYFNNAHVKLPYKNTDDRATPGWYYAWDSNNLGISEGHADSLGGHWDIPVPTGWIVADTNPADGAPAFFEVGSTGPDVAMTNQEMLRLQIRDELPGLNTFVRLYEDDLDLTPTERMAAPVDKLWWWKFQDVLLSSPHIVSLEGHGASSGR